MWQTDPQSREGQLWLQQFNLHFSQWLQFNRTRDELLLEAAADLKHLLERSPEYALQVQSIALSTVFNARITASPNVVSTLARIGNEADVLQSQQSPTRSTNRILLNFYLAESDLKLRSQFSGLEALERAEQLMQQDPPVGYLADYLQGYLLYLRGALSELGLAYAQAAKTYEQAAKTLDLMMTEEQRLVDTSNALLELIFGTAWLGDKKQAKAVFMLVAGQIQALISQNALGRIRTEWMNLSKQNLEKLASGIWQLIYKCGIPAEIGPLDIFPLVLSLPAAQRLDCGATLINKIGEARGDYYNWQAIFYSTLLSHPLKEDVAIRQELKNKVEKALHDVRDPLVKAFVLGQNLVSQTLYGGSTASPVVKFLDALNRLVSEPLAPLDDIRVRALFDEPVTIAIDWACREFKKAPDAFHRTRLAVLMDALRGSKLAALPAVTKGHQPRKGTPAPALQFAVDRLQRIAHALRSHPGAAAIVLQRQEVGYLFICVTGDEPGQVHLVNADPEYEVAAGELAHKLQEDTDWLALTGELPVSDTVTPAGKNAYQALPPALQELITANHTLLIVPDFRANADDVPFELFHDGKGFLGANRIIARFTSLRLLTHAVEHLSRRLPHKRALVASASHLNGRPDLELPLSREEIQTVQGMLVRTGWDTPVINEHRLSPQFFIDRLEYISLLHIAAHGQVAINEAIIMPDGARLTTEDLLRKRFSQLPVTYLNICSIGQAHYVGAGISRGIAHAMVEAGAPAVVANLLPVEDRNASQLALEFYRYSQRYPFGEALRLARNKLAKQNVHPILWGTTILIGDPWVTLEPGATKLSTATQLLDAYFSLSTDDRDREDKRQKAIIALLSDPGDVRLQASVELLRLSATVTDLSDAQQRAQWDQVVRLADEIDHLPAMALARYVRLNQLDSSLEPADRLRLIDDAVRYIEPMAVIDQAWERLLLDAHAKRSHLDLGARDLEVQMHNASDQSKEDELQVIMDTILGAQARQEAVDGRVTLRQPERNVDDVLWNAVVIGHGNRFEDMPEAFSFSIQLAAKLHNHSVLPAQAMPYAPIILVGFLYFIWHSQNLTYLAPEMVEGWVGALKVAITELAREWAPPSGRPWFKKLDSFSNMVDAVIERLNDFSYEEIYHHLDPEMSKLQLLAKDILVNIQAKYKQALAGSTGWIMGTIIQKNTFSPLDGSVPEDIGEHLCQIYFEIESIAEGCFMSWLMDGFQGVRERQFDELQRWKANIEPEHGKAKRSPPPRGRSKSGND